jgi:hypothetical protein
VTGEGKRRLGRPPEAGTTRDKLIQIRATAAECEQFKAVGVTRFRRWLAQAYLRTTKKGGSEPPASG